MWKPILGIVIVVVIVALIFAGAMLRHGFNARNQPSQVETVVARSLRHRAIPKIDRDEENPWAGSATPEVMAGARQHFADHCAQCHANDGSGKAAMGQNLYPKAPDMRIAATQNLTDGELYYIITHGVPLTGMPAWGDKLIDQDDESWQLVLFIRHLPQLSADELKEMELYNPKGKMEMDDDEEHGASPGGSQASPKHHH